MENHKPLTLPTRCSKRNSSKIRKPEEIHSASRSSQNCRIGGTKVLSKNGSSKRKTLERCPSPPYSQEDQSILQDNQNEHFNFEIIVKEEEKEEKKMILVTIGEEDVLGNISSVARRRHRNRKQTAGHSVCFIESQTAKIPRLRRMELKVKELISSVRSHRELWDPSDRGYSDRQMKTAAWTSVCRDLYPEWDILDSRDKGILDNDVRKRWRSARDQFRREIVQREGQNGSAPPSKKPYIYLEELMFLIPVLDLQPANSNGAEAVQEHYLGESEQEVPAAAPAGGASDPSDGGKSVCSEEPTTTSTVMSVSQQVLPLQHRRRKDEKTTVDTIDSQILAYMQRHFEEDAEDAFVRSLGSYIRKVPLRWRLWLRSGIQTLIEACIPPNDPEKVLVLLDQVKLARPPTTAPPMDIEFMAPLAAYQSPSHPHYGLSSSSQPSLTSYPQSTSCSLYSFPQLPSYHSHPSTLYTEDSPSQPSYAFHSHQEPRSQSSFPSGLSFNCPSSSNIPPASSSPSGQVSISTPPSCFAGCGSSSPPTYFSYTTSRPQSQ